MAGKKRVTGGSPAWMVTFADLMSLLLCLFVLLLSFSTMDVQKFKQIAGEMEQAFGLALKSQVMGIIETGGLPGRNFASPGGSVIVDMQPAPEPVPAPAEPAPETDKPVAEAPPAYEDFAPDPDAVRIKVVPREPPGIEVAKELSEKLAAEIDKGLVQVEPSPHGVLIRFNTNFLFQSGSAEVVGSAAGLVSDLSKTLAQTTGEIQVSGHTDNVPISTDKFRSNWDLSAARAASMVQLLLQGGTIEESRLAATGYADSRPIASNDTEAGRALNRRVEIQILMP